MVGAINGPFGKVPFSSGPIALSPLNSIPRDDSPQHRIIVNLNCPPPSKLSVNASISCDEHDRELFHLCYLTVDNIVELIVKHGVRCYIFKRDLCCVYHQFPVDLLDYPLLGYLGGLVVL